MDAREVLFEITVIGSSARVCAIDAVSGIEVTVVAPAGRHVPISSGWPLPS
jgi:hypothetical protein